ncbi:MAG: hypothetical protein ABI634_07900 [Acidobacteriota bacterium]
MVSRRVFTLTTATLLVATLPAWAGQAGPTAPDNAARSSTFTYEMALRGAVVLGGQKLAQQAATIVPDGILAFAEQPIVRGVKLDGWGYFFDVQAPNIQSTIMALDMMNQSRRGRPNLPVPSGNPDVQPVTGRAVVSATGTVEADPNDDITVPGGTDRAYSKYVREALIDALLDSSAMLQLAADDHLTIAAQGIDQPGSNPLYQSRKLMITIKGSDLQDMRQGRITRDQAKARIVEGRF